MKEPEEEARQALKDMTRHGTWGIIFTIGAILCVYAYLHHWKF